MVTEEGEKSPSREGALNGLLAVGHRYNRKGGLFSRVDLRNNTFWGKTKGPNPGKVIPMAGSVTNPLYGAIDAKLAEIAAANPTPPSWYEGLNPLGSQPSKSERLGVYRAVRAAGLRYREEGGFWEVWIFPTPVELVGGAHDGAVVVPGITLDLEEFQAAFDKVEAFVWNALGLNYPEGPHIAIEGVFLGREVYLQVSARAPEDEEPGLKVDASRRPRRSD
jgi:hypothetical protein